MRSVERVRQAKGGPAVSKRKENGRVTVEEVDLLFQRPLALLRSPERPRLPDPGPAERQAQPQDPATKVARLRRQRVLVRSSSETVSSPASAIASPSTMSDGGLVSLLSPEVVSGTPGARGSAQPDERLPDDGGQRRGLLDALRVSAAHLWPRGARLQTRGLPAADGSAADLTSRLEESLLEASCLAAELQRRYRESQGGYEQAREELRELIAVLVEQLDPNGH